jgi:hypothetical protein
VFGSVNAVIQSNGFAVSNSDTYLTCANTGFYNVHIEIASVQDANISLALLKNGIS